MRQVPKNPSYLLIGDGRLARHLSHYLGEKSVPVSRWNRNDDSSATLIQKLKTHDYTLLCISDDQLISFYEQFGNGHTQMVHFSGSVEHPQILGFHPLMSFDQGLYDLKTYESIFFIGTSEEKTFRTVFQTLNNSYQKISFEGKKIYHSLCVLSGNGTTLLWDLIEREFEKIGIKGDSLRPYLKQVSENILEDKKGRWSGPWYRHDTKTIDRHRAVLSKHQLGPLYAELENLSRNAGHFHEKHS